MNKETVQWLVIALMAVGFVGLGLVMLNQNTQLVQVSRSLTAVNAQLQDLSQRQREAATVPAPKVNQPVAASSGATILVSKANGVTYCNGDAMDSDGYRKTLTKEQSITLPPNLTESERVKAIIVASTGASMCANVLGQLDITVANGIVRIPPIDGWAGISIAMCTCVPEVEVNALRIPGITKVEWNYGASY